GAVTVSASATDNVGVVGVQLKLDGTNLGVEGTPAPYSDSWNTTLSANGGHSLSAVAGDAAGNTATSAAVSVTVNNPVSDTTPPTVSITAPAAGSMVSGTITVSASATDDVRVVVVQFLVDGNPIGPANTTAPYSVTWDTTTTSSGAHTLTAVARDAAGNTAISAPVSVTVASALRITNFTPTSGPVGTSVTISGTNFTGATAVTFNGVSASFTVTSPTAIQATVPAGATTGPLSVTTPGGTVTSFNAFTVNPLFIF